ncbi:phospho-sugar mutase [Anaerorhabdus sp.]|uniref:phospho-sugar mutase n=1 Tax=Anaerorhabdus sp. TaxID=1872524 RepID=UPI002FCB29D8
MLEMKIQKEYEKWLEKATKDTDLIEELISIKDNEDSIVDAFYTDLTFGTGGLRGVIGAGTNRVNVYTIAKASHGLANYINKNFESEDKRIAVSYDSRIKSELFAEISCAVFAANGIETHIYKELMPTPCLSFAVRELNCAAGIMVTASHNPAKYNGYKVYGSDGCQITTEAASDIYNEIKNVDIFSDSKSIEFQIGVQNGMIKYIEDDVYTKFINCVKNETMISTEEKIDKNVSIVYSPLNGTGLKPVLRVLNESGYTNIKVVEEQKYPDGHFPTCPYPNPEIQEAMALGIEYAKKYQAELLLATDPDCDRVGIAVKDSNNEYQLITGNEVGLLLFDYICARRIALGKMPKEPVVVKTIVTTDLTDKIAEYYGVKVVNVLTGFKFIGEQIGKLEKENKESSYIFGFEESYGYLSGTYVRDKDAVNGAFLICEMFSYYKSKGISLIDKLNELYNRFGYCLNTLHSYEFEGPSGFNKMQEIMNTFRSNNEILGLDIKDVIDYSNGIDGLPKSNVIKLLLNDDSTIVVRPSGTEPKLKIYLSLLVQHKEDGYELEDLLVNNLNTILK